MFRTTYRTKNVPDRLFITAKTKKFREDFLSKQNIPDYLSHEKKFRTGHVCIGATNTANGKLHTKVVQIYFP